MKIAAFYENILTGAEASGLDMVQAVAALRREGLELLYLGGESLRHRGDEIAGVLRATGLGVEGVHAWMDLAGRPGAEDWRFLIEEAARLGARHALLVPGLIGPERESRRAECMENMLASLRAAVAFGRERGVTVCMEDLDNLTAPYCTADGLAAILEAIPGLSCCFDTGNLIQHGEDELAALERFRPLLCGMHLKDRARTPRNKDDEALLCLDGSAVYPAPVGEGEIRIGEILNRLRETDYGGSVVVELYGYSPEHMLEGLRQSIRNVRERL